ncbi:MAG TPA: ATP-binding protein [Gemmatimonadaceae bacterium]|nr:ATP-binding protein [Gemmatimonadaceae bacterium]
MPYLTAGRSSEKAPLPSALARTTIRDLHMFGRRDRVGSGEGLTQLIHRFESDSECFAVVVWDAPDPPRAIMSRDALARHLSRPFAGELFRNRPLDKILDVWSVPVLVLPATESIETAVTAVLNRPPLYRYEPVLVQGDDDWFLVETHVLLAQQCDTLAATIDEVERQRRSIVEVQEERERLHQELVTASRHAGRAEVATGVLHNVGNVLNSVNASAALMARTLRESKLANLGRAVHLIREHESDLAAFLATEERGRRIPGYLVKLAETLAEEQRAVIEELRSLEGSIEHIRQIVQMQQSYARSAVVVEPLRPAAIVEDAIRVNLVSFGRHNIRVRREYADLPPLPLDKHKVLQILINLISNAKNATKHKPSEERQVIARIAMDARDGHRWIRFQIADNGIGIAADLLTKIFSIGFTTHSDGHGFGLHSAANAATEMGGVLTACSDGPGRGATFTLDVPVPEAAAAAAAAVLDDDATEALTAGAAAGVAP